MKKSLFMILFVAFTTVIVVTLTVRSFVITYLFEWVAPQHEEALLQSAFRITELVDDQMAANADSSFLTPGQLTFIESLGQVRVWISRTDGKIIFDNRNDDSLGGWEGSNVPKRYMKSLKDNDIYLLEEPSPWDNKKRWVVAVPILQGNEQLGYVILFSLAGDWESFLNNLDNILVLSGLCSFAIGIVMTRLLTISLVSPIQKIHEYVRRLGKREFDYRIKRPKIHELGILVDTIEEISNQLKYSFISIEKQEKLLRLVLEQMTENVLVINHNLQVLIMNTQLSRTFSIEQQSFLSLKNSGLPEELIQGVSDFFQKGQAVMEFMFKGRTFYTIFSELNYSEEQNHLTPSCVVFIRDITEQRQSEQIRHQFIANVSHEIRTPLTGISSLVEALKDDVVPYELQQKYFEMLYQETRRLARMTSDLIQITKLDVVHDKPSVMEAIYLQPLLEDLLCKMSKRLQDRNQTCRIELCEACVWGNSDWTEQIFLNLLDNASRFMPEGKEIIIRQINPSLEEVVIEVIDEGIGIPEEALPRIWDRFYKVDEARTRNLGGSGLGLSIVKQLVERQNGRIDCDSELGRGTRFTVWFKRSIESSSMIS